MKKLITGMLATVMAIITIIAPIGATTTALPIEEDVQLFLEHAEFTPNNKEEFQALDEHEIVGIFDNVVLFKKNINSDGSIQVDSLTEENILKEATNKRVERAITETYKSLPEGKHSTVTYWTVNAPRFGQTTTTYYLTPNPAARYANKGLSSGVETTTKILLDAMIGAVIKSPYVTLALAAKDILNDEFYKKIANLADKNKGAEVRISKNNMGKYKAVLEWNRKTVRYRSGSNGISTEKTTIEWSSAK